MKHLLRNALFTLVLLGIVAVGAQVLGGNFHTVYENEVYRSAQLSAPHLAGRIDKHGIRSIINLRGGESGEVWYEEERAMAEARGVTHVDYKISAYRELEPADMDRLVALMATLPKPLLIHCWGGADRSGLAAALYLYAVKDQPAEQAARQLSARYGHVPYLFWSGTKAMDDSFRRFAEEEPTVSRRALP